MPNHYFTTGQVMGITQTSPASLYRYVKSFGEFFSKDARRPKRGKRWTTQDVNLIYTIRQLYFRRSNPQAIQQFIKESPTGFPAPINLEQISELAGRAIQLTETTSQEIKRSQSLANLAESRSTSVLQKLEQIQREQKKLNQEVANMQRELLKMKWMIQSPSKPPSPKRRRAYSIWQEFKKWTFDQWDNERIQIEAQENP